MYLDNTTTDMYHDDMTTAASRASMSGDKPLTTLNMDDLALRFGFNRQTWRRWCFEGKVKAHMEGKAWVVEEDDARAWAEARHAPEARRAANSQSMQARQELQRDPSRSNAEIARQLGASPSVVSVERRKLGLPRLPYGGAAKAPPGWKSERKPKV